MHEVVKGESVIFFCSLTEFAVIIVSALKSHLFILLDPINRKTTNSPQEETPSLQHEKVKTFLLISLSFPYNNTIYMCVILYSPVTVIIYPPKSDLRFQSGTLIE